MGSSTQETRPFLDQLVGLVLQPVRDLVRGLRTGIEDGWRGALLVWVGVLTGWWLYVPLHEMLHALACTTLGGTVRRLEIGWLHGAPLLSRVFEFVDSVGPAGGRLADFEPGSDAVFLAVDLAPYVLTVFPGVWAMRASGRHPLLFGLTVPVALAPFLALTGDAYEIGAILVTRLPPWSPAAVREMLRADDLFAVVWRLAGAAEPSAPLGAMLAFAIGLIWALVTYRLGVAIADRFDRRARTIQ